MIGLGKNSSYNFSILYKWITFLTISTSKNALNAEKLKRNPTSSNA
jgi:hypothetical protein